MPSAKAPRSPDRPIASCATDKSRTRIANGSAVLAPAGAGNSWWARRYAEVIAALVSDLGGADAVSAQRMALIRRAAALIVELEQEEAELSKGRATDLASYTAAVDTLVRLVAVLGMDRVASCPAVACR